VRIAGQREGNGSEGAVPGSAIPGTPLRRRGGSQPRRAMGT
jgi:hypothetical protein